MQSTFSPHPSFLFSSLLPCLLFLSLKIAMHIAYTQKIFLNELIWNINSQQKFYGRGNATFITCLLSYSFPPFLCFILIMGSATAYCIFQTQLYTGQIWLIGGTGQRWTAGKEEGFSVSLFFCTLFMAPALTGQDLCTSTRQPQLQ